MRRTLLVLTFISVVGWSQPAQPQAQPLIVINNQMPREGFWAGFLKVAVPTILAAALGSGIAFYGLRQTNEHHAAENDANRKHELEKLNREHSFALKRDALIRVTQSLVQTFAALKRWHDAREYPEFLAHYGGAPDEEVTQAVENVPRAWAEYESRLSELEQVTAASCLAVSDKLWKSAQTVAASLKHARDEKTFEKVGEEIIAFTKAAREELGIVHIDS